jgi:hypothetical protein
LVQTFDNREIQTNYNPKTPKILKHQLFSEKRQKEKKWRTLPLGYSSEEAEMRAKDGGLRVWAVSWVLGEAERE